jgi:hypothetical protein
MRTKLAAVCGIALLFGVSPVFAAEGDDDEGTKEETNDSESDDSDDSDSKKSDAKEKEDEAPKEPATVSVNIEPFLAIFGFYEGGVDLSLTDTLAVELWGQYFDYTLFDTGISGYGLGLGAPIFLTGEVYRGAYVFPLLKFQQVKVTVNDEAAGVDEVVSATFYGPQATIGYQWTWGRPVGFSLRLGGGLEYTFGKLESDNVNQDVSFDGLDYEIDIAIGASF